MDCDKQKDDWDRLSNDGYFPKPIWVRYFGVQTNEVNKRLLEHNVRSLFVCGPIIWFIIYFF